jgi:nicotinate phosphoribosyltransferase
MADAPAGGRGSPGPQQEAAPAARCDASASLAADIAARVDSYFNRTKTIAMRFGDMRVTYAVFLRRPVISAPRLMTDWLAMVAAARGTRIDVDLMFPEGAWVGAGEPLCYITGSFVQLSDLETILLQKVGPPCVAAHNAYQMCLAMPQAGFLAMEARHCAGAEMQDMMAYAAAVGSNAAKREGAKGFIGNANDGTAHWFGTPHGFGTMPHSLIGYAGSTVRAAEMFRETFPDEPMTVLVDYFGREITDALAVCARFPELAAAGQLSFRLDTHGGRFLETLDPPESYAVLERHAPGAIRRYRSDTELRFLVGTGVSAAAVWRTREALDNAGYRKVRIVASSGFGVDKCRVMADAKAPIDVVGTGSFIPDSWHETYATADIVEYDGMPLVKVGREFLLRRNGARKRGDGSGTV